MQRRNFRWLAVPALLFLTALAALVVLPRIAQADHVPPGTYVNPAHIVISGTVGMVESFADPSIIRAADGTYYAYGTTDPLNGSDKTGNDFNFHLVPMISSTDMVHWTYLGDAFTERPSWLATNSGIWAPDIEFMNGQYYLYYTAPDTMAGGSAIGVATSDSPAGPWVDSGGPVVEPHTDRWVFDPEVIEVDGQKYIFFGSYYGGISARKLSADGLLSDAGTQVQITIANRYEGANVIEHDGFFYLFASAADCCHGPLTGYSVFAGRSENIMGPYVDQHGVALLAGRAGGAPVISLNGNRWVGPGHNAVITDESGQDWFVYHAIDRNDPYFTGAVGFTKRPLLMDPLNWIDGWPQVRSGNWASDSPQPAPVTVAAVAAPTQAPLANQEPGAAIADRSDEFDGSIASQWGWVRPSTAVTSITDRPGYFRFNTQDADLNQDSNNASLLVEPAPAGNFMVEVKLDLDLPAEGCCYNYRQGGVVIYGDDNNFLKLAHFSLWETRQVEWAKELFSAPSGYPRYGNTVLGPPAYPVNPSAKVEGVSSNSSWLRIAVVTDSGTGEQQFTAYNSLDGLNWTRGGTWTHNLTTMQIGLFAMAGSGSIVDFDYVRVYALPASPAATATSTTVPTGTATDTPVATSTMTAMPTGTSTAVPTAAATMTPCPGENYSDVASGDYFHQAVNWLFCRGAVDASPEGSTTFKPYDIAARAVIVKMIVLANGFPIDTTGGPHFSDVPASNAYYQYVETARNLGIISGYANGTFNPTAAVTRGQIAKIVVGAQGWTIVNPAAPTFSDVPTDNPFYKEIETAVAHYVISGYDCTDAADQPCPGRIYKWYNNATRGQVAKIVYLAVTTPELQR